MQMIREKKKKKKKTSIEKNQDEEKSNMFPRSAKCQSESMAIYDGPRNQPSSGWL